MSFLRDQEDITQEQIAEDVRDIMRGEDVRNKPSDSTQTPGDTTRIYPGGEDAATKRYGPGDSGSASRQRAGRAAQKVASEEERRRTVSDTSDGQEVIRRRMPEGRQVPPGGGGRGIRRRTKVPYLFVSYAFVAIFVMLAAYLVYFNLVLKDDVLNSPYNRRQDDQAEYVVRGDIVSSDGTVLATTETDDDGSETRVYPENNEYAHVVGFASNGKSGLEQLLNYDLLTSHNNIADRIINEFRDMKNPGDTVVTTLDASLQDTAYDALGDWDGAVVVMEPDTGNVLAMVSKPDFDPNTIEDDWDDIISEEGNSQLVNRATQGRYPPGSTFKIVTALAYYREHGTIDGFSYDCSGTYEVDDENVVHCYDSIAHGEEDLTQAFANSCNCAFSVIGLDVGARKLGSAADSLLFNSDLPCKLDYTKSSFTLSPNAGDASIVQTAFGQGDTLVSPYHLALIVSAIANDGMLMKTNFVDHIENATGTVVSTKHSEGYKRIMTEDEADTLTDLMKAVVEEGTGKKLSGLDYEVACKTGSAEFEMDDGEMGTHSWFVGFSNPDDPDIVVAVVTENGGAGSSTSLPIAKQLFDAYYAE